jgi:methylmalonyl-CoA/ethylmalonyl-CoA epimerase
MTIKGIDHIVIAVQNLDAAIVNYENNLGLKIGESEVGSNGTRATKFDLGDGRFIELAEPAAADTPMGHTLEKRGGGVHLIALRVTNMATTIEDYKSKGIQVIVNETETSTSAKPQVFVHPRSTNGVLIELIEHTD